MKVWRNSRWNLLAGLFQGFIIGALVPLVPMVIAARRLQPLTLIALWVVVAAGCMYIVAKSYLRAEVALREVDTVTIVNPFRTYVFKVSEIRGTYQAHLFGDRMCLGLIVPALRSAFNPRGRIRVVALPIAETAFLELPAALLSQFPG